MVEPFAAALPPDPAHLAYQAYQKRQGYPPRCRCHWCCCRYHHQDRRLRHHHRRHQTQAHHIQSGDQNRRAA